MIDTKEVLVTSESGNGKHQVVIKCASLAVMQDMHRAVLDIGASRQALEGEPFTWVFTDVNGKATELAGDPVHRSPQDLRVYTPLYKHPASADAREEKRKSFHQGQVELMKRFCVVINEMLDGDFTERYGLLEPWNSTHERLKNRLSNEDRTDTGIHLSSQRKASGDL